MSIFVIQEARVNRSKEQWIRLGVQYVNMKKRDPSLTMKEYADYTEINYNSLKNAFRKLKVEIQEAANPKKPPPKNPSKEKKYWVELGVKFIQDTKQRSAKQFAQDNDLNYETFSRNMRKFRQDINDAIEIQRLEKTKRKNLTKAEQKKLLINDFRATIRKISGLGKTRAERRSKEWFQSTIKDTIKAKASKGFKIGRMYAFMYDAKHKAKLPVWDVFPLIIYLGEGRSKAGNKLHYGLNVHYLRPKDRKEFLEDLLDLYASTPRFNQKTRLKIDWTKVKHMKYAVVCIHSYLPNHLKTPPLEIHTKDWGNTLFLPTQKFVGPDGKTVGSKSVWSKY